MPGRRAAMRRTSRRTTRRTVHRTRRRRRRRRVMIGGMVVLAAAGTAAAIKLSQKDAQRVEEYTGMPVEDLTDEDLNQAMQELNIQPQEVTAEEQATMAQSESAPAGQPTQAAAAAPAGDSSYVSELEELARLRDNGIITSEDFEAKKKQILGL